MKSSTCIGAWQEALCADVQNEFSEDRFEELLKNINLGERINSKYQVLAEWCEDYYWTSEGLLQMTYQESSNPYSVVI